MKPRRDAIDAKDVFARAKSNGSRTLPSDAFEAHRTPLGDPGLRTLDPIGRVHEFHTALKLSLIHI